MSEADTFTTSCLLCGKELVWHCDWRHVDMQAHDYCSTWCRQGHTLLKKLHAELSTGRRLIDDATDRASAEALIASNVKQLVLVAYDGFRRLDNMAFHRRGQSHGQD